MQQVYNINTKITTWPYNKYIYNEITWRIQTCTNYINTRVAR